MSRFRQPRQQQALVRRCRLARSVCFTGAGTGSTMAASEPAIAEPLSRGVMRRPHAIHERPERIVIYVVPIVPHVLKRPEFRFPFDIADYRPPLFIFQRTDSVLVVRIRPVMRDRSHHRAHQVLRIRVNVVEAFRSHPVKGTADLGILSLHQIELQPPVLQLKCGGSSGSLRALLHLRAHEHQGCNDAGCTHYFDHHSAVSFHGAPGQIRTAVVGRCEPSRGCAAPSNCPPPTNRGDSDPGSGSAAAEGGAGVSPERPSCRRRAESHALSQQNRGSGKRAEGPPRRPKNHKPPTT